MNVTLDEAKQEAFAKAAGGELHADVANDTPPAPGFNPNRKAKRMLGGAIKRARRQAAKAKARKVRRDRVATAQAARLVSRMQARGPVAFVPFAGLEAPASVADVERYDLTEVG